MSSPISDLIDQAWSELLLTTISGSKFAASDETTIGHWLNAKSILADAKALADQPVQQQKSGGAVISGRIGGTHTYPQPPVTGITNYGISTGAKITAKPTDWAWELDEIKNLGGGLVRFDYGGSGQDWLVQEILNRGMKPMLLIGGTLHGVPTPSAHAQAVTAAMTKWKGKVPVVEVGGNEPNLNGQTPQQHAALVKASYTAAKAVDPKVIVLNGGIAPAAATLSYALQLVPLLKGSIDHFNMHLYEDAYVVASWNNWSRCFDPSVLGGQPSIRQALDSNGMSNIPICSTESGANVPKVTEAVQAKTVFNAFDRAAKLRATGDMSFVLIFSMRNTDYAPGWGLCRDDHSRRPSWTAAKNAFV